MPLRIVASFISIGNMGDMVSADVFAARPMVLDPDIDFWAFGIILLEHRCEAYCQSRFRGIDLTGSYSSAMRILFQIYCMIARSPRAASSKIIHTSRYLNLPATCHKAQNAKSQNRSESDATLSQAR